MEDRKNVTLYCFIYKVNEDEMSRQEDKAEFYRGDYFIHDEDDDTIYVQGWKIDRPEMVRSDSDMDEERFVYMYSLNKDIHSAMKLIGALLKDTLKEVKDEYEYMQDIVSAFEAKQEYVKSKYSSEE